MFSLGYMFIADIMDSVFKDSSVELSVRVNKNYIGVKINLNTIRPLLIDENYIIDENDIIDKIYKLQFKDRHKYIRVEVSCYTDKVIFVRIADFSDAKLLSLSSIDMLNFKKILEILYCDSNCIDYIRLYDIINTLHKNRCEDSYINNIMYTAIEGGLLEQLEDVGLIITDKIFTS